MCGIVGQWRMQSDPVPIEAALSEIAHRGPDGSGVWTNGEVHLGHARLAILELSEAGAQPMSSDDGQVVITYNGEIYNFAELRQVLEATGVRFYGGSDTEVLLRLYEAEGMAMLPKLNGMFAFAVFDGRSGDLFVVRDGFGVKPLYYSEQSEGFSFCSEIKGLLPLLADVGDLDSSALLRYLTFLWCPGVGTPLKQVRKLAPGEWLRVRSGRVVERQQWYVQPLLRTYPSAMSKLQAAPQVASALRRAVHRQLVADVPVGAFLSGGLDSSAVVAFAREQTPGIRCFTIATPDGRDPGDPDDLPYARRVAEHLDVRLDVVEVDAARMAACVEKLVWHLDEPLADPAPLNVLFISQLARDAGIKVLLSGTGGDDLFTGYRRHRAVSLERWWRWLPRSGRAMLERLPSKVRQQSPLGRRLAKAFRGASLDGDRALAGYFMWGGPEELAALLHPDLRAELGDTPVEQPMLEFLNGMPPGRPALDRMLALEQRFFLGDHNLIYTDKMSMAAGVEVRVPFLDMELAEFAASIPVSLKQRGSVGKSILKSAMEPYLPHDVIYRPKTGFGAPLRRWLKNELRELLRDLLSEHSIKMRGLFDAGAVQALIRDTESGRRDGTYPLFALMCIEIWCRQFLDRNGYGKP